MNINIFMKLRLLCKAENLYLHKFSFTSTLSYLIFFIKTSLWKITANSNIHESLKLFILNQKSIFEQLSQVYARRD